MNQQQKPAGDKKLASKNRRTVNISRTFPHSVDKNILDFQKECHQRAAAWKKQQIPPSSQTKEEKDAENKRAELMGEQMSAAARNRLKQFRDNYQKRKQQEIQEIINQQPNALMAERMLRLLSPVSVPLKHEADPLDKLERARVEAILDDRFGRLYAAEKW